MAKPVGVKRLFCLSVKQLKKILAKLIKLSSTSFKKT